LNIEDLWNRFALSFNLKSKDFQPVQLGFRCQVSGFRFQVSAQPLEIEVAILIEEDALVKFHSRFGKVFVSPATI